MGSWTVRRWAAPAVGAAACALSMVFVEAQGNPPAAEPGVIGKLTAQTREQAVACGREGPGCAIIPYQLCPGDGRYTAALVTPFSRVASAAAEAEKTGRPLGRMGPAAVNRWGVSIAVSPAAGTSTPESITRVEIRRNGRVVQPATSTVGPITIALSDGSSRVSTRGVFTFAADVFEPSGDLNIVFVGSAGETSCTLDRPHLAALR
jgi:hypothetical protein